MAIPILEIKDLKKTFGKIVALNGIDLSLQPGDYCGFVGPNGAGKSTTIHCLLNLQKADSGDVQILPAKEIGFMDGESNFPSSLKVKEVLDLSARLYGKDCQKKQEELCRLLDLDGKKRIRELSLGNRKKVGIVCALQHSPRLLILDEPTNGLDPLVQNTFFELLKDEHQKGTTILLSSHNLKDVEQHCHRVVFIKEGKIILEAGQNELQANPVYQIRISGSVPEGLLEQGKEPGTYLFHGNANQLIQKLSQCDLTNVEITRPDMEERFLELYRRQS